MTEGTRTWKCDHDGRPDGAGKWMRPTTERIGEDDPVRYKDYWAVSRSFPADNHVVWWFRLRFRRPGEYRFRLKINSTVLYEEFRQDFRVHVEYIEGEPTQLERIDQALDDGEALLAGGAEDQRPVQRKALREAHDQWIVTVFDLIPAEYIQLLKDRTTRDVDPAAKSVDDIAEIRTALAVVYEIRRRFAD